MSESTVIVANPTDDALITNAMVRTNETALTTVAVTTFPTLRTIATFDAARAITIQARMMGVVTETETTAATAIALLIFLRTDTAPEPITALVKVTAFRIVTEPLDGMDTRLPDDLIMADALAALVATRFSADFTHNAAPEATADTVWLNVVPPDEGA